MNLTCFTQFTTPLCRPSTLQGLRSLLDGFRLVSSEIGVSLAGTLPDFDYLSSSPKQLHEDCILRKVHRNAFYLIRKNV